MTAVELLADRLTPTQLRIAALYLGDHTEPETAALLVVSIGAVKQHKQRAAQSLGRRWHDIAHDLRREGSVEPDWR